jgi:hypothetical protein
MKVETDVPNSPEQPSTPTVLSESDLLLLDLKSVFEDLHHVISGLFREVGRLRGEATYPTPCISAT